MKHLLAFVLILILLGNVVVQQAERMQMRPTVLKLGPVPNVSVLKAVAGEFASALAFRTVTRVMFYFGSFFEDKPNRLENRPEYLSMYNHLKSAVRLDPYNLDAYYFAQAAFTWEIRRSKEVNSMLDYGMKYRTWDYQLPFFAGFNAAYFLKDYAKAAQYMKIAAERSGNPLFTKLAARYFHEAGQTEMGLVFLDTMEKGAHSEKERHIYQLRKEALIAANQLEKATKDYEQRYGRLPENLAQLVKKGILKQLPADPYGGEFYLDQDGKVRSTSKFVMRSLDQQSATKDQSPN